MNTGDNMEVVEPTSVTRTVSPPVADNAMDVVEEQQEFVVERPTVFEKLELAANEWMSIYIPVLSDRLLLRNPINNELYRFYPKYLRDFLEKNLRIGKVKRIDFVDRDIPNSVTPVKAAFVHFEYWYNTPNALNLREKLNTFGQFRQKGYMRQGERYSFYLANDNPVYSEMTTGYFDIRINHKPIQDMGTDRNVNQLHAEILLLEKACAEKDQRIIDLEDLLGKTLK